MQPLSTFPQMSTDTAIHTSNLCNGLTESADFNPTSTHFYSSYISNPRYGLPGDYASIRDSAMRPASPSTNVTHNYDSFPPLTSETFAPTDRTVINRTILSPISVNRSNPVRHIHSNSVNMGRTMTARTQSNHSRALTRPDVSSSTAAVAVRGYRSNALCCRASYMCRKCKTHGHNIPVKRHKRACPYMHCTCLKCHLVDQGRKVVAKQIALYRDQKGIPGRDSTDASSSSRSGRSELPTGIGWNQSGSVPISQGLMNETTQSKRSVTQTKFPLPTESLGTVSSHPITNSNHLKQAKQSGIAGPHCRRCRNHSLAVTWKGHKKTCPFRNCPCDPCRLINVRKDTEKTLREMASHNADKLNDTTSSNPRMSINQSMYETFMEASDPAVVSSAKLLSSQAREKIRVASPTTTTHNRVNSINKKPSTSRSIRLEDKSNSSEGGAKIISSTSQVNTVHSSSFVPFALTEDGEKLREIDRRRAPHLLNFTNGKFDALDTQALQPLWSTFPLGNPTWPLRSTQLPSTDLRSLTLSDREGPMDWLINPLSVNATFETNHYHHHHHHHVHIETPPQTLSCSNQAYTTTQRSNNCSLNTLLSGTQSCARQLLGNQEAEEFFKSTNEPVEQPNIYSNNESSFAYPLHQDVRHFGPEPQLPEEMDTWSADRSKSERLFRVNSQWINDKKSGYNCALKELDNSSNCCSYEPDTAIDPGFYCPERVSAVAAAAAAAAAMVAMAPPMGSPSKRRCSQHCYQHACGNVSNEQSHFDTYYRGAPYSGHLRSIYHPPEADEHREAAMSSRTVCQRESGAYPSSCVEDYKPMVTDVESRTLELNKSPTTRDRWTTGPDEDGCVRSSISSCSRNYQPDPSPNSPSSTSISFTGTEKELLTNNGSPSVNLVYSSTRPCLNTNVDLETSGQLLLSAGFSAAPAKDSDTLLQSDGFTTDSYLATSIKQVLAARASYSQPLLNERLMTFQTTDPVRTQASQLPGNYRLPPEDFSSSVYGGLWNPRKSWAYNSLIGSEYAHNLSEEPSTQRTVALTPTNNAASPAQSTGSGVVFEEARPAPR
ncbi:hypothetical protein PHET_05729 [Paragonimus heterotremus]|uniref:DM domain-containing protein n=1 Tax=Paragonimus heterotremus TaxID=100268 RepID=A0A8J4TGL6_9TREM|nr:hypothetical protein PHET_05729 [Paragonimus heterotremus]